MDKAQGCEVLNINEIQFSRLVKQNKIAVRDEAYDDFDVEPLRQHVELNPGKPLSLLPASFRSHKVSRLRFNLIAALKEAVITSGLRRDEAPRQLSNLVCEIWVSCESVTWKLPG